MSKPTEFLAWADKPPGLMDFALTSMSPSAAISLASEITERICENYGDDGSEITYTYPQAGSRTRKDGVQVQWESSRPYSVDNVDVDSKITDRTDVPFFCHDVTSRTTRVPFNDETKTTHPCGAVGIAAVEVLVPRHSIQNYKDLYTTILGSKPEIGKHDEKYSDEERFVFEVGVPNQSFGPSAIHVCSERNASDTATWPGDGDPGISSLFLNVKERGGNGRRNLGTVGIASTILLEW